MQFFTGMFILLRSSWSQIPPGWPPHPEAEYYPPQVWTPPQVYRAGAGRSDDVEQVR